MREAREIREEADYGAIIKTSEAEARDLAKEARVFVEEAAALLAKS